MEVVPMEVDNLETTKQTAAELLSLSELQSKKIAHLRQLSSILNAHLGDKENSSQGINTHEVSEETHQQKKAQMKARRKHRRSLSALPSDMAAWERSNKLGLSSFVSFFLMICVAFLLDVRLRQLTAQTVSSVNKNSGKTVLAQKRTLTRCCV